MKFKFPTAPYLRTISFDSPGPSATAFPFHLPLFRRSFDLQLTKPITIFVGENGSGKSTLLEGIASKCGFSSFESAKLEHIHHGLVGRETELTPALDLSWSHYIKSGFFLRAESFIESATLVDQLDVSVAYDGKSLHRQSHGESFLSLFNNRLEGEGIYILDEPEAALSPLRQLSLLKILRDLEKSQHAQVLMATHSPMLLTYPGAQLLALEDGQLRETDYRETEHYTLTTSFLQNPERFYRQLFAD